MPFFVVVALVIQMFMETSISQLSIIQAPLEKN